MLQNAPCKMLKNGAVKKTRKTGCSKERWQRLWQLWAGYVWPKPALFLSIIKYLSLLCPARLMHNQVNSE